MPLMAPLMRAAPLVLLLLAAVGLAAGADLEADLAELAQRPSEGPLFDEDQDGYDKHADIFYYQDNLVDREYERRNYLATKITLAGQKADATLRSVKPAVWPFGVAQRTYKPSGVLMDRWDVKDTGKGVQYLALYHGKGSTYVVNKVRAHLLRMLANALQDFVPSLSRLVREPLKVPEKGAAKNLTDSLVQTVQRVFEEVDLMVRRGMADSDASYATATVAVVADDFVLTATTGAGRVIGYTDDFETRVLTPRQNLHELSNVFGAKKNRKTGLRPKTDLFSRQAYKFQFLLMETAALANDVRDDELSRIVLSSIQQHKYVESEEQEIYSGSLERIFKLLMPRTFAHSDYPAILDMLLNPRFFLHSDYSAILVGLNTDYESVH